MAPDRPYFFSMGLLKNLGLFFIVFLPAVALASMLLAGLPGARAAVSPEWRIGWNPVPWLIMTAPWLLPTILLVPALHLLGKWLVRKRSRGNARLVIALASSVLFPAAALALWGPSNLRVDFVLPIVISALGYGLVFRLPRFVSAAVGGA